ncbi:hypothetical protein F4Y93_12725 [Candidatus Poribacteria bacterium]|nr:hypothetical protein [Candidatus Poribacteria bacterium]
MADTRSGAAQLLTVGSTALTEEDNVQNFRLNYDPATFSKSSGGVTSEQNAGPVSVGGSFRCYETNRTLALFLGRNGDREDFTWTDGTTTAVNDKECIMLVSRVLEDRGARYFAVTFEVDGSPE